MFWDNGSFIKVKGFWPEYSFEDEAYFNDTSKWSEYGDSLLHWDNVPAGVLISKDANMCTALEMGGFEISNISADTKPEDIQSQYIDMTIETWD